MTVSLSDGSVRRKREVHFAGSLSMLLVLSQTSGEKPQQMHWTADNPQQMQLPSRSIRLPVAVLPGSNEPDVATKSSPLSPIYALQHPEAPEGPGIISSAGMGDIEFDHDGNITKAGQILPDGKFFGDKIQNIRGDDGQIRTRPKEAAKGVLWQAVDQWHGAIHLEISALRKSQCRSIELRS